MYTSLLHVVIIEQPPINNCVNDLHNKNLYNGKIGKRDLFKNLETTTSKSYFIFNYLYKQVEGEAIGSPLGTTLVKAFLCHYERKLSDNCRTHIQSEVYKRCVDDSFVIFSSKEHFQSFVDYMNKQHA